MTPVDKALWFIDGHFAEPIDLDQIAAVAGVSRFHLCRCFAAVTGLTVMRRLRHVRLHAAARMLAGGAPDILTVAIDCGYGSHAAFTHAFRDRFGIPPERFRADARLRPSAISLQEPYPMQPVILDDLAAPRIETAGPLVIAGLSDSYDAGNVATIPALWQRLMQDYGCLPGQIGGVSYGICYNGDGQGRFDYLAGMAVESARDLPAGLQTICLPARRYLVFAWPGHISQIRNVVHTIWNKALPERGITPAAAPDFERYPESFDGRTGDGGFEIWIPLPD